MRGEARARSLSLTLLFSGFFHFLVKLLLFSCFFRLLLYVFLNCLPFSHDLLLILPWIPVAAGITDS